MGSIPRWGRSPGRGNGNPLHYSCLENLHGQRSLVGYSPWDHRVGHFLSSALLLPHSYSSFILLMNDSLLLGVLYPTGWFGGVLPHLVCKFFEKWLIEKSLRFSLEIRVLNMLNISYVLSIYGNQGFPSGSDGKDSSCNV